LTSGEYDYIVATLGQDCLELSRILENDLEAVTASHYPVIERMKNALLETGAEGALMTGSGPSVFGIFKSEEQAVEAKTYVSSMLLGSVHVATCWEGTAIPS
jgi:4-diphosphocytidyl-2-C-methyl-D-erythritol kinase